MYVVVFLDGGGGLVCSLIHLKTTRTKTSLVSRLLYACVRLEHGTSASAVWILWCSHIRKQAQHCIADLITLKQIHRATISGRNNGLQVAAWVIRAKSMRMNASIYVCCANTSKPRKDLQQLEQRGRRALCVVLHAWPVYRTAMINYVFLIKGEGF